MIGDRIIRLESVDSTNRYARDLLRESPAEGSVIVAEIQTAGRGRMDRRWISAPAQNVLATVIVYPPRELEEWGGLPLLAGLAVTDAVRELSSIDAHVKWPNDVLVGNRKLSGILVESGRQGDRSWAILGIGVNVNQVQFEGEYRLAPTSMTLEAGRTFDTEEVLTALCRRLDALYALWCSQGNAPILGGWKNATRFLGKRIVAEEGSSRREGRALDLGHDGSLIIEFDNGVREHFFAGDVSLREEENEE